MVPPLTSNFTDASSMATNHAAHHNALAAAVNSLIPRRVSGRYYDGALYSNAGGTTPMSGTLYYQPFVVPEAITVDRICIEVTAATASTNAYLGIYSDDGTIKPGALLLNAGSVDTGTTGVKELTISQALPVGWYWLVALVGAGTFRALTIAGAYPTIGNTVNTATQAAWGWSEARTYAQGLPNPATPTGQTTFATTVGRVQVRVA